MECGDPRLMILKSELPRDTFELIKECMISERLDAAKRLAGWFAHEVNNPLGAILGSAQLLERRLDIDITDIQQLEKYKNYLGIIQNQIDRCAQATGESINSFDIGEPVIRRTIATEAVQTAIDLVRYIYADAKINVRQDCEIPDVKADQQWLARILFELVTNALEESTEKPISIRLSYCIIPGEEKVLIRTEDLCCGIPENIQWKVFAPYFSTRERARGLGLTLSLEMAVRMNGDLILEKSGREGSVFLLSLPTWRINDDL